MIVSALLGTMATRSSSVTNATDRIADVSPPTIRLETTVCSPDARTKVTVPRGQSVLLLLVGSATALAQLGTMSSQMVHVQT